MSTNYSLTVKNNSNLSGNVCVYQTVPNQDKNLFSLAWFSKSCHPGTTLEFDWTIDYCFTWSETGMLVPGVRFLASQTQTADPQNPSLNAVGFSKQDGAYLFTRAAKAPSAGSLGIYTDGTVPNAEAAVGVGMGGKSAFAIAATPNFNFIFSPHPQYWVAFGNFQSGEVMDLNAVNNYAQVTYPVNVYAKTAVLNEDNTWTVDSLKSCNERIIRTRGLL